MLIGSVAAQAQTAAGGGRAADPRAVAREILAEKRFRGSQLPRPFAGPLRWLGERLARLRRLFDDLAIRTPGGAPVLWLVIAALVITAVVLLVRRSIRAGAGAEGRAGRTRTGAREDPRDLERDADRAAAAGAWEAAVRLRFRAGLLRLDAREAIEYRPSLATWEVAAALRSPAFERVGADFDAIAYGGREAHEPDATASREGWQRVLSELGTR